MSSTTKSVSLAFHFPPTITPQGDGSYVVRPGRPMERKSLRVQEVACELGVSEQQVINLIDEGNLEAIDVGDGTRRHWRVMVEALTKFMEQRSSLRSA